MTGEVNEVEWRDNLAKLERAGGTRSEEESVRKRWRQSDGGSQSMPGAVDPLAC